MATEAVGELATRIPAWKRIASKPKHAKDEAPAIPQTPSQPPVTHSGPAAVKRPRNQTDDDDDDDVPKKSVKLSSKKSGKVPAPEVEPNGNVVLQTPTKPKHKRPDTSAATHDGLGQTEGIHSALARKKSVTFTPDTKQVDGFSAHKLFQNWKADQQNEQADADIEDSTSTPEAPSPSLTKAEKREKKRKARAAQTDVDSNRIVSKTLGTAEYISYLQQFHTDKSNWKFNKNKQSELFKNFFNLYRIPIEHDAALLDYVAGLQGAASQRRLLDDAEVVLKELLAKQNTIELIEGKATRKARKSVYDGALERISSEQATGPEDAASESQVEFNRYRRADAVLSALIDQELPPPVKSVPKPPADAPPKPPATATHVRFDEDLPEPAPRPQNSTNVKKKRTRKSRTEADSSSSSDDDSSDDSSSSSDSSSSDEDSESDSD